MVFSFADKRFKSPDMTELLAGNQETTRRECCKKTFIKNCKNQVVPANCPLIQSVDSGWWLKYIKMVIIFLPHILDHFHPNDFPELFGLKPAIRFSCTRHLGLQHVLELAGSLEVFRSHSIAILGKSELKPSSSNRRQMLKIAHTAMCLYTMWVKQ